MLNTTTDKRIDKEVHQSAGAKKELIIDRIDQKYYIRSAGRRIELVKSQQSINRNETKFRNATAPKTKIMQTNIPIVVKNNIVNPEFQSLSGYSAEALKLVPIQKIQSQLPPPLVKLTSASTSNKKSINVKILTANNTKIDPKNPPPLVPVSKKTSEVSIPPLTLFKTSKFVPSSSQSTVPETVTVETALINSKKEISGKLPKKSGPYSTKSVQCNVKFLNSSTMTTPLSLPSLLSSIDKNIQTDIINLNDCATQTEVYDIFDAIGDWNSLTSFSDLDLTGADPEQIAKFKFRDDIRKALNYDQSGNMPIHTAVIQNDCESVAKNCRILTATQQSVDTCNLQNCTPLHLAVLYDVSIEVLNVLLRYNVDLGVTDNEGNTPLHLAVEYDRKMLIRNLLDRAKKINFDLNVFNYEGFTPLIISCSQRNYELAKMLLEYGADPNVKDMKSGRTALFHAVEVNDESLVQLLMDYKSNTKIRNFFGTSPHDAMFELEEVSLKIKSLISGRDEMRFHSKRKSDKSEPNERPKRETTTNNKRLKVECTPILRPVNISNFKVNNKIRQQQK